MKTKIFRIVALSVLMGSCVWASAQGLRSAYFSDSYIYRHQMNPALGNTSGYVAMPLLGNFNLNAGMNFGVKNFIYEQPDGSLTTFMNKSVDTQSFLGDLKDNNRLIFSLDLPVMSVGFNAWKGHNTIDVGIHSRSGLSLPKGLFAFMKEMQSGKDYAFTDLQVRSLNYADIALGHSRQINEAWRVGAKVKVLLGLAYADASFSDCTARFGEDKWTMSMQGDVMLAGGGEWTTDDDGLVDGYDDFTPGVNGFGMAFDLGATYDMKQLVDGLKLSAAVTDLGWIKWDVQNARPNGTPFTFDGFHNVTFHESDEDPAAGKLTLKHQWEGYDDAQGVHHNGIKDDLEDMYQLRPDASKTSETMALGATVTFGAEYEIPVYKKVSFGLLYTQRFAEVFDYVEGRFNVNYAPSKAFDLSLSAAVSNYGGTFGAVANVHCPGFNLFIGTDRIYTKSVNSDFVPLESGGVNVAVGLNFPFGF